MNGESIVNISSELSKRGNAKQTGNKEDVSLTSCSCEKTVCMGYYTIYASNLIYP